MNYYNIKYSPVEKSNDIQRIIYNKKIYKIRGFRKLKTYLK